LEFSPWQQFCIVLPAYFNSNVIKVPNMVCYVVMLVVQCLQVVKCLANIIGQLLGFVDLKAFFLANAKFRVAMFGIIPPTISKRSIS
jgi:hypothetical protein